MFVNNYGYLATAPKKSGRVVVERVNFLVKDQGRVAQGITVPKEYVGKNISIKVTIEVNK